MCDCESERTMDMKTPRNVYLSAFYKRSFAFYTVKNRMPIILTHLVDSLARNKAHIIEEYGDDAKEELKTVIGELSEFKYEIQTNKPLKLLTLDAPDIHIYNEYIQKQATEEGHATHFHTIWLLAECYMYRRIKEIFEKTKSLKTHDPFRNNKQEAYRTALPLINTMSHYLLEVIENSLEASKNEFISMLKILFLITLNFHPTKLCILRTVKADIICGLREGLAEKIEEQDPKWMETGNWAVIQFCDKTVKRGQDYFKRDGAPIH
ncbi:hypothetical protein NQ318_022909, partial [Aromia moschata]